MPKKFRFLNLFAGQTVVNRLNNYLMLPEVVGGRSRINRLENLLCLSPTNHRLFGRGFFALEPLGDPLAVMRVCRAAGMAVVEEDWDSSDGEDSQPGLVSGRMVDATYMVQRYLTERGNSEGDAAT